MTLPTASDPIDILLAYNRWATIKLLKLCEPLEPSRWRRPFEMGPGTLEATFTHIIGALRRWADRIDGRTLRPRIDDGTERTPAQLIALLEEAHADFCGVVGRARAEGLGRVVTIDFGGKPYTFTAAGSIMHALNHGTHHRAQCLNMMRHVGLANLPEIDLCDWQWFTECVDKS